MLSLFLSNLKLLKTVQSMIPMEEMGPSSVIPPHLRLLSFEESTLICLLIDIKWCKLFYISECGKQKKYTKRFSD